MSAHLESFLENPPKEDSQDLSDDEVAGAVATDDAEDVVRFLREQGPIVILAHELRRRGDDLYWRVRIEPDRSFVFQVSWLGG